MQQNPVAERKTSIRTAEEISDSILQSATELSIQSGEVEVGLAWDFIPGMPVLDLDASAVLFSSMGHVIDAAYYNQLSVVDGCVTHSGDQKKGDKSGYDEVIKLKLDELKNKGVSVIMFILSAYDGGTLTDCESASVDMKCGETHLASFSVAGYDSGIRQSLILGILFKHPMKDTWHFQKICQPCSGRDFMGCMIPMRKYVDRVLDPGAVGERTLNMDKTFKMEKGDFLVFPDNLYEVTVGLGWTTSKSVDIDASCILLRDDDGDGDLDPQVGVGFFNLSEPGVKHMGDNRTGDGEGDDEQILVDLKRVRHDIDALAFVVNVYSNHASFSSVTNSYIRLFDPSSNHEFARLTLGENISSRGVIFCVLYRGSAGKPWTLLSCGEECEGRTCKDVVTKLWDGSLNKPRGGRAAAPTTAAPTTAGCCIIS